MSFFPFWKLFLMFTNESLQIVSSKGCAQTSAGIAKDGTNIKHYYYRNIIMYIISIQLFVERILCNLAAAGFKMHLQPKPLTPVTHPTFIWAEKIQMSKWGQLSLDELAIRISEHSIRKTISITFIRFSPSLITPSQPHLSMSIQADIFVKSEGHLLADSSIVTF